MKKILIILSALFTTFIFGMVSVNALELEIANFSDLQSLAASGGEAKLTNDIVMTDDIRFLENTTLDLNGHNINTAVWYTLIVRSDVIFKDTSANPGKITNGQLEGEYVSGTDYQAIQVGGKISSTEIAPGKLTIDSGNYEAKYIIHIANGTLIINGGKFTASSYFAIGTVANEDKNYIEINGGEFNYSGDYQVISLDNTNLVMNSGKITSTNGSGIVGFKDSNVVVNNGTIDAYNFAIAGNGSASGNNEGTNAKFTVNGGRLSAKSGPAIYAPQINGETKITGGTLTGAETGIEIRAGKLTITGGTLNGNTELFESNPNGNGTSTKGSAVAIAQHTTKEPINVSITGGTFNGYAALSITNPQGNSAEDLAKITLNVTGGTFNATGEDAIISEDVTGFVKGGTYSSNPSDFVANGFIEYTANNKDYEVLPAKSYTIPEEEFFVEIGKTIPFAPTVDTLYAKYLRISTGDNTIATYQNGIITGVKVGKTTLIASLGRTGDSKAINVYELTPAITNDNLEKENNKEANIIVKEIIDDALNGEEVDGIAEDTIEKVKDAIVDGKTVSTEVSIKEMKEEDIPKETLEKIEEIIDKKVELAKYLDIDVILKADNENLGYITALSKQISISLEIDKKYTDVPKGYTRKYFVIRLHEGEEPTIIDAEIKDGKLVFETNKFSTYAIAYKDTVNSTNPKTFDRLCMWIILFSISIIGFGIQVFSLKKTNE